MTDLSVVGILLLIVCCALLLIALEVLIPGVSVAGMIAFALIGIGTVWCWSRFGAFAGILLLTVSLAAAFLIMRLMMHSIRFGKLARSGMFLNTESAPIVHSAQTDALPTVGSTGRTTTMLRPSGIAQFGDNRVHVTAQSGFIEADTEVVVLQAEGTHIIVAAK